MTSDLASSNFLYSIGPILELVSIILVIWSSNCNSASLCNLNKSYYPVLMLSRNASMLCIAYVFYTSDVFSDMILAIYSRRYVATVRDILSSLTVSMKFRDCLHYNSSNRVTRSLLTSMRCWIQAMKSDRLWISAFFSSIARSLLSHS